MSMSQVNIPLLRKAVEWAEAEAVKPVGQREWEQARFITLPGEYQYRGSGTAPSCGTAYCVAGYVAQALDQRFKRDLIVGDVHVSEFAQDALGLDDDQGDRLFDGGNTIAAIRRIAEDIAGERL